MERYNRYAKKLRSRDKDRKRFLSHHWPCHSIYASWDDYKAHQPPWSASVPPWRFDLGKSSYARSCLKEANRRLRNAYRMSLLHYNETCLPQHAQYKKCYNYNWHVW